MNVSVALATANGGTGSALSTILVGSQQTGNLRLNKEEVDMSGGDADAANKGATPQAMILRPAKRRKKIVATQGEPPAEDKVKQAEVNRQSAAERPLKEASNPTQELHPADPHSSSEQNLSKGLRDSGDEDSAVSMAFAEAVSSPTDALPELKSEVAEHLPADEGHVAQASESVGRDGTATLSGRMRPFAVESHDAAKHPATAESAGESDDEHAHFDEGSFSEVRDETIFLLDSRDRDRAFESAEQVFAMGTSILDALCGMFPGRLFIDRHQFSLDMIPPTEEHGPVVKTLSLFEKEALDSLVPFLVCQNLEARFYAMLLIDKMKPDRCPTELYDCLYDRDSQIQGLAQRCFESMKGRGVDLSNVCQRIVSEIDFEREEFRVRSAATAAQAILAWDVVPRLIDILGEYPPRTNQIVLAALRRIGLVELNSPYDWKNWWTQAREEGRVASLIHGTTSHSEQIRIWVSAEIANIAGLDLQYDPHGPPEEWKNAASVLKEWFRSTSN